VTNDLVEVTRSQQLGQGCRLTQALSESVVKERRNYPLGATVTRNSRN
jgi:hypothetical protein